LRDDSEIQTLRVATAGGTDIGIKGLQLAAKTLALTAADFYENPALAAEAHAELVEQRRRFQIFAVARRPRAGTGLPSQALRTAQVGPGFSGFGGTGAK